MVADKAESYQPTWEMSRIATIRPDSDRRCSSWREDLVIRVIRLVQGDATKCCRRHPMR
jgi:hypothetical protein